MPCASPRHLLPLPTHAALDYMPNAPSKDVEQAVGKNEMTYIYDMAIELTITSLVEKTGCTGAGLAAC